MSWYLAALKKYAVFSGRARRKEYWMFVLFYLIFTIVLGVIDSILGIGEEGGRLLSGLFVLAMLIPSLAVTFAGCTTPTAVDGGCLSVLFH